MSHSGSDDDDASSFEMISSSPITGHHQLQHDESRLSKGYISVPNPLLNLSPDGGQKHEKVDVGTSGGDSFSGSDFSDEWDHVLDPTQCCINCDDDEHDETENVKAKRSLVVLSKIDASTPQQAAQDSSPDKSTHKTIQQKLEYAVCDTPRREDKQLQTFMRRQCAHSKHAIVITKQNL